jgi:hypothetical protein
MTVKMKKGDLIANINDSPESIAHAYSMGYVPVDKAEVDAAIKADFKNVPDKPEQVNQVPGNTGPENQPPQSPGPEQPDNKDKSDKPDTKKR